MFERIGAIRLAQDRDPVATEDVEFTPFVCKTFYGWVQAVAQNVALQDLPATGSLEQ